MDGDDKQEGRDGMERGSKARTRRNKKHQKAVSRETGRWMRGGRRKIRKGLKKAVREETQDSQGIKRGETLLGRGQGGAKEYQEPQPKEGDEQGEAYSTATAPWLWLVEERSYRLGWL